MTVVCRDGDDPARHATRRQQEDAPVAGDGLAGTGHSLVGRSARPPRQAICRRLRRERRGAGRRADRSVEGAKAICHIDVIRTTLDIDDDLMTSLLARLPGRSKTDAIEHAIEVFLANDAVERLRKLAGTMDIEDLSRELRTLDRTT